MLAERRGRLAPPFPSNSKAAPLITAITSRLWLSIIRWALRGDLQGSLPPGLELFALPSTITAGLHDGVDADYFLSCNTVLTTTQLLPLLDTVLSDYDSLRKALWPLADRVVQQCNPEKVLLRRSDPSAASRQAREYLTVTGPILEDVFGKDMLQMMSPDWLQAWGLQLTEVQVCMCQYFPPHSALSMPKF
jgi:hypothetical protein